MQFCSFESSEFSTVRKSFNRPSPVSAIPSLRKSVRDQYDLFLQRFVPPNKRKNIGLQKLLLDSFPILFTRSAQVQEKGKNASSPLEEEEISAHFVQYFIGKPLTPREECYMKGSDYAAPLIIEIKFLQKNERIREGRICGPYSEVDRILIHFGDVPLMAGNAQFIINGIEKTVISQLQRSDGIFSFLKKEKDLKSEEIYNGFHIIPKQGESLQIGINAHQQMVVRISSLPTTCSLPLFCCIMSLPKDTFISCFFPSILLEQKENLWVQNQPLDFLGQSAYSNFSILTEEPHLYKKVLSKKQLQHKFVLTRSIVDPNTHQTVIPSGKVISGSCVQKINQLGAKHIYVLPIEYLNSLPLWKKKLWNQINHDYGQDNKDLEVSIRKWMGVPTDTVRLNYLYMEELTERLKNPQLFFFSERAKSDLAFLCPSSDLKQGMSADLLKNLLKSLNFLIHEDVKEFYRTLIYKSTHRAARHPVSFTYQMEECLRENLFSLRKIAFLRFKQMNFLSQNSRTRRDQLVSLFKTSVFRYGLKELFNSSSLGQLLDSTNSLSEETHKRRATFLGKGGLTANTTTFKDRDVQSSHYGKLCPIETPEGKNVGLVVSPTGLSSSNLSSLIQIPCVKIKEGKLTPEVHYIDQQEEKFYVIAFAHEAKKFNSVAIESGTVICCRHRGELFQLPKHKVDYVELCAKQIISLSSSLIPFLEHNDASRALMGSNMQRQAVPIAELESPLVGTGAEFLLGYHSRGSSHSSSSKNLLLSESRSARNYLQINDRSANDKEGELCKKKKTKIFKRSFCPSITSSNQKTSIYYKPTELDVGEAFTNHSLLYENNTTSQEQLSLGTNLTVAFMSFDGQSFEDSIVVSDRVLKSRSLTSYHIKVLEGHALEAPNETETFTSSLPEILPEKTYHLDKDGVPKVGSFIKGGDILFGKIKTVSDRIPPFDQKKKNNMGSSSLLANTMMKNIFKKEKSNLQKYQDVDASILMKTNQKGKVVEVIKRYRPTTFFHDPLKKQLTPIPTKDYIQYLKGKMHFFQHLQALYHLFSIQGNESKLARTPIAMWKDFFTKDEVNVQRMYNCLQHYVTLVYSLYIRDLKFSLNHRTDNKLSLVRLVVSKKSSLKAGDKLTGRHGNKGVVCKIVKEEDMPYTQDGHSVDVVLNPMGISSRMNMGQVYETNMGWLSKHLGSKTKRLRKKDLQDYSLKSKLTTNYVRNLLRNEVNLFAHDIQSSKEKCNFLTRCERGFPIEILPFESASDAEIDFHYTKNNLWKTGQVTLYDGKTGAPMDRRVTIGFMYILKLNHLVEEKVHARTTGPYHLITQQPLGGKSKRGGQRLGEMEVWALQGYGSAYNLQEMVTVKSDSLQGRSSLSNQMIYGNQKGKAAVPEAFQVLLKELQALGLHLD